MGYARGATEMTARLDLPERLDTEAAGALKDELLTHIGHDLDLDASAVDHLGAMCLQVLVAASKTWDRDQHKLSILNVGDVLKEQLSLFGFSENTLVGGAA